MHKKLQMLYFFILLLSLGASLSIYAKSDDSDLRDSLDDFSGLQDAGRAPRGGCDDKCLSVYETASLYSPINKKYITLSVVSAEKAKDLFKTLKNDEKNVFDYAIEGCFARAHRMALTMDDLGVVSGKIFLEGNFPIKTKDFTGSWEYHTASLIYVKKKGKLIATVIDPILFDSPVSVDEWKKKLLKDPQAKMDREFYTKRFIFNRKNLDYDLTSYDEGDIEAMRGYLKGFAMEAGMNEILNNQKLDKKR